MENIPEINIDGVIYKEIMRLMRKTVIFLLFI